MLEDLITRALEARSDFLKLDASGAYRLFAGFYEGEPNLVVDLYGRTLLMTAYGDELQQNRALLDQAQQILLKRLPWVSCVLQKQRLAADLALKRGQITFGESCDDSIMEQGVRYALDLQMNQDASFYLDTRMLRAWLIEHNRDLEVLNAFAYTGSLGVAALAGGARRVLQTDRNARFMELARRSAMLNHFDLGKMKLRENDFFSEMGHLKKEGVSFDIGILDPPFFSVTEKGKVDMVAEGQRLINKMRPLIKDGGHLIVINNALFLSGREFLSGLEVLCRDGYLAIEEFIPVPREITGYPATIVSSAPADPAPFNHSTKIAVLKVRRKAV